MKDNITQERLKEVLHYNPATGIFINKMYRGNKAVKGSVAGSIDPKGYIKICVDKKIYLAHRLVFLYMEGYLPENDVDHVNRKSNDNRWGNLRHVNRTCNMRNSKLSSNNTSSVSGVSYCKKRGKWVAHISNDSKAIGLGHFKNFNDAVLARWNGEIKYEYPNCNTTSTAYEYLKRNNLIRE